VDQDRHVYHRKGAPVLIMFAALRARLQSIKEAPTRARELAAQRLTARCRTGHVEPTGDGLRVVVHREGPYVSPVWAAEIEGAIADALREGGS
jgi:hypothetical protein